MAEQLDVTWSMLPLKTETLLSPEAKSLLCVTPEKLPSTRRRRLPLFLLLFRTLCRTVSQPRHSNATFRLLWWHCLQNQEFVCNLHEQALEVEFEQ